MSVLEHRQGAIAASGLALACGTAAYCAYLTRKLWRFNYDAVAPDVEFVLSRAQAASANDGSSAVTLDHIVAALHSLPGGGPPAPVASGGGGGGADGDPLTKQQLEDTMKQMLFNQQPGSGDGESALERFTTDMTAAARRGKLDPLVGRDSELRRVVHILSRRTKNNPVLVGESGVGKTAIVEGLAQRIVAGDVPVHLLGAQLVELDLPALAAGCVMPGEFEERLRSLVAEITGSPRKIVLFIDDIHNLVPSAANAGATMLDGSAILKPALARGDLRCLGASSTDKFKKTIERDPGLERRFQQVVVEAPSVGQALSILRGLRPRYEAFHGVTITEGALRAAAELSARYIAGRQLPDKAIDCVDEATAQVRMEASLKPERLDALDRTIAQLQTEQAALARAAGRRDRAAARALTEVGEALVALEGERATLGGQLEVERAQSMALSSLRLDFERARADAARAEAEGEEEAAVAKSGTADALAAQLEEAEGAARGAGRTLRLHRDEVTESDIARVISKWTGIPISKLVASEREKLLALSMELHRRIIGQEDAVEAVASAIQRARADLADPNGPIASFMFLGPTGVGKTELAKALASFMFNSEDAMVRIDCSEYMEKHSVSRLIGAPPGYVGYDEGGLLSDAVRRRPYSVVLFDEVEKAHVDVFNVLLQILDDGRVTDSQGRTVSFKNCLIILTSNLGSRDIFAAGPDAGGKAAMRERVMDAVRGHFRPEFINRVDEFIVFEPLQRHQIHAIVGLRAQQLVARVAAQRMRLVLEDAAIDYLAAKGYDPVYGARPVKRALQRELQTLLAQALLRGDFVEDDTILVDAAPGGGLCLRKGGPSDAAGVANGGAQPDQPSQPQQIAAPALKAAAPKAAGKGPTVARVVRVGSGKAKLLSSDSSSVVANGSAPLATAGTNAQQRRDGDASSEPETSP